jgi:Uma2 family endonuclease
VSLRAPSKPQHRVKAPGKRCYDEETMSSQPTTFVSPEEYLAQERLAERKSEYFQGEVFAMAGASPRHVWIVSNLNGNLWQQLKGKPCRVSASDLRLRVTPDRLYTYPDLMVICGEPQFADDQKDTVVNPVLIVEVLSESTRNYDRGWKFQHYRKLPSLIEYLLIEQDEPRVEHWTRQRENHWDFVELDDLGQSIQLTSISCMLALTEVYDKIEWS